MPSQRQDGSEHRREALTFLQMIFHTLPLLSHERTIRCLLGQQVQKGGAGASLAPWAGIEASNRVGYIMLVSFSLGLDHLSALPHAPKGGGARSLVVLWLSAFARPNIQA